MKPILFNIEDVHALQDRRKNTKRLVVEPQPPEGVKEMYPETRMDATVWRSPGEAVWAEVTPPYRPGDILYVCEPFFECKGHYYYEADEKHKSLDALVGGSFFKWCHSVHMPKEAARLFLRVTDVRMERLQDITIDDAIKEGCSGVPCDCSNTFVAGGTLCCADCMNTGWQEPPTVEFWGLWDSTIKKADLLLYGWDANPWVWVIEFEIISKDEAISVECKMSNSGASVPHAETSLPRKETTMSLSKLTEKLITPNCDPRIYWAKEVTFDYATTNPIRVDYMKFKPVNNTVSGIEKGDFYCYEIKSSVEDFHSKNGHNFIGDFNYYVMPEEVYEAVKAEIPYRVGVYCPTGYFGELKSVKKAKRQDRARPVSEMLLMMFRSAARDRAL